MTIKQNITKYDFTKILKNFNIKISIENIDEIFKNYSIDKIQNTMNYELYLNDLILGYTPKERQNVINYIYDTISERGENFEREIDIPFLREVYNAKNNYFDKRENENRAEFEECFEIYHYSYNGLKTDKVSKKEFCYFYYFISLLIPSDEDFFFMITNEWRAPIDNNENIIGKENKYDKLNNLKISDKDIRRNLSNMSRYAQLGKNIKDYQENLDNINNNKKSIINNNNYNNINEKKSFNKKDFGEKYSTNFNNNSQEEKEKSLSLLKTILIKRGLRGILYLYSQFLSFCPDINKITFNDFNLVFKIQHIDLNINIIQNIFDSFSIKNNNNEAYLDFYSFIRVYKKELNENKLNIVEQAFTLIDEKGEDRVPLDVIKMKYNAKNHPDVKNGKYDGARSHDAACRYALFHRSERRRGEGSQRADDSPRRQHQGLPAARREAPQAAARGSRPR